MRWPVFAVLLVLIVAVLSGIFYRHATHVIALKRPPASLAQWYKPENKRQVWLHTMFKLRREMLALEIYAGDGDAANLQKWAGKFAADYRKISEMAPEWESRLDMEALSAFEAAAAEKRFADVVPALKTLGQTCTSCHDDFRAVTAALYRAPDFSQIKVAGAESYTGHMKALSEQVNRTMIGFIDGRDDAALAAFAELSTGMAALGKTCVSCHKKDTPAFPDADISAALAALEQSLKTGTLKDKGRALGTLAVKACATCHGTHRLSGDVRQLFATEKSMGELLDHSY